MSEEPGRLLTGFARVITHTGPAGDPAEIRDGAIAVREDSIAWVGAATNVPIEFADYPMTEFAGLAAMPGFVDSHTHAVFAGDRSDEFGRRLAGASYEEILAAGGGIHATVAATRAATPASLTVETGRRLAEMLSRGTTTAEIKSGYGLDVDTEVKQLEVANGLGADQPVDVTTTFLAHVVPTGADQAEYVDYLLQDVLPAVAPLAQFCDVFCDEGTFTTLEATRILQAGRAAGLTPRVHAEQLTHSGGALVAAQVGAASADHLDYIDDAGIRALRDAGVVATLLPGVSFTMQHSQPPGRTIWDAGVTVALATDCNPGTSYLTSMPMIITLAVLEMGLTIEEAVWAATKGGALALQLGDRGWLGPGAKADVLVLDADHPIDLAYRPGSDLIHAVFKDGIRYI